MMPRFRITSLIILVAIVAVGLGVMRLATDLAAKAMATATILSLLVGLTGALVRRTGAWLGFAAFSLGFTLLVHLSGSHDLVGLAVETAADHLHPNPFPHPPKPKVDSIYVRDDVPPGGGVERSLLIADFDTQAPSFTTSERQAMKAYQGRIRAFFGGEQQRATYRANAEKIGHQLLAIVLGCLGAIVGRELDRKRPTLVA